MKERSETFVTESCGISPSNDALRGAHRFGQQGADGGVKGTTARFFFFFDLAVREKRRNCSVTATPFLSSIA